MGPAIVRRVECSRCQIVVNSPAFAPFPGRYRLRIAPQPDALLAGLLFCVCVEQAVRTGLFMLVLFVVSSQASVDHRQIDVVAIEQDLAEGAAVAI